MQEYQAFQRLGSHPNIIKFKGAYEDSNSVHFITSPYCSGGTLLDWLNADTGIPVSEGQLATYFKQVVEAVSWCHGKGEPVQPILIVLITRQLCSKYKVITKLKHA